MAKYKVGDKVKIKDNLKSGEYYGGVYFLKKMEKHCGKITVVKAISGFLYNLEIDNDIIYCWSEAMLEDVELTKQEMKNKISELEQQIAELKEQLEKKDNKMPVGEIWKPECGKKYYYINGTSECIALIDTEEDNVSNGNHYPTREKAEFEANREKYTRLFRQYVEQHSEPLDWNNDDQMKYALYYEHPNKQIKFLQDIIYQQMGGIYANSEQVLKEAIDFVGEDNVKKYILGIGE